MINSALEKPIHFLEPFLLSLLLILIHLPSSPRSSPVSPPEGFVVLRKALCSF